MLRLFKSDDAGATQHARRKTRCAADIGPRFAAVGGFEQSAAWATARHLVLVAERLPHRREHHIRVVRIDGDVNGACLRPAVEYLAPRLAAISGLVDAALVTVHAIFAEIRDEHDVGIRRMDADLRDRIRVLETDVRPGL